jgi:hypothetical protein
VIPSDVLVLPSISAKIASAGDGASQWHTVHRQRLAIRLVLGFQNRSLEEGSASTIDHWIVPMSLRYLRRVLMKFDFQCHARGSCEPPKANVLCPLDGRRTTKVCTFPQRQHIVFTFDNGSFMFVCRRRARPCDIQSTSLNV